MGDKVKALKEVNTALELHQTYLEAIRLKERILKEIEPEKAAMLERKMLEKMDDEETSNWHRY